MLRFPNHGDMAWSVRLRNHASTWYVLGVVGAERADLSNWSSRLDPYWVFEAGKCWLHSGEGGVVVWTESHLHQDLIVSISLKYGRRYCTVSIAVGDETVVQYGIRLSRSDTDHRFVMAFPGGAGTGVELMSQRYTPLM